MARSVAIFPAALMYQKGKLGMHFPSTVVFQNFSTGVQLKMTTRSCEMAHIMMMIPSVQMTFFILCTDNTRQY